MPFIEVQRDVVAGADAALGEHVREPVDPVLGVGIGQTAIAAHERLSVGHRVDDLLPQIGEVVLHRPEPTWCYAPRRTSPASTSCHPSSTKARCWSPVVRDVVGALPQLGLDRAEHGPHVGECCRIGLDAVAQRGEARPGRRLARTPPGPRRAGRPGGRRSRTGCRARPTPACRWARWRDGARPPSTPSSQASCSRASRPSGGPARLLRARAVARRRRSPPGAPQGPVPWCRSVATTSAGEWTPFVMHAVVAASRTSARCRGRGRIDAASRSRRPDATSPDARVHSVPSDRRLEIAAPSSTARAAHVRSLVSRTHAPLASATRNDDQYGVAAARAHAPPCPCCSSSAVITSIASSAVCAALEPEAHEVHAGERSAARSSDRRACRRARCRWRRRARSRRARCPTSTRDASPTSACAPDVVDLEVRRAQRSRRRHGGDVPRRPAPRHAGGRSSWRRASGLRRATHSVSHIGVRPERTRGARQSGGRRSPARRGDPSAATRRARRSRSASSRPAASRSTNPPVRAPSVASSCDATSSP